MTGFSPGPKEHNPGFKNIQIQGISIFVRKTEVFSAFPYHPIKSRLFIQMKYFEEICLLAEKWQVQQHQEQALRVWASCQLILKLEITASANSHKTARGDFQLSTSSDRSIIFSGLKKLLTNIHSRRAETCQKTECYSVRKQIFAETAQQKGSRGKILLSPITEED